MRTLFPCFWKAKMTKKRMIAMTQLVMCACVKKCVLPFSKHYVHHIMLGYFLLFYCSIEFLSVPIPSILISIVSPGCKNFGGLNPFPTPDGVPVAIISPASKVVP